MCALTLRRQRFHAVALVEAALAAVGGASNEATYVRARIVDAAASVHITICIDELKLKFSMCSYCFSNA